MHTISEFISRRRLKRLAIVSALFWLPVIIFSQLAEEVLEGDPIGPDEAVLKYLYSHSSPALDQFFLFVTDLGGALFITLVASAIVVGLTIMGYKRQAAAVFFSVVGAAFINVILKLGFQRDRPALWTQLIVENAYSFPSGHAMGSAALALAVIVLLWSTKWRYVALGVGIIYMLLIGLSRLYLGVHYPTDVIAGWCISLVWILIVKNTLSRFEIRGKKSSPAPTERNA